MKRIYLKSFLLLSAFTIYSALTLSQVPEGFNYMAIARDGDGNPISKTEIGVRFAILDADETVAWEEEHTLTTDDNGLFQLVIGDPNAKYVGGYEDNFADIDWTLGEYFVSTSVSLVPETWISMGSAQLFSVPYALVSKTALGGVGNPFTMYGTGDTVLFMNAVHVKSSYDITEEEALFAFKRSDGKTMFAVYNQGVRINIPMVDDVKGAKGGFAATGKAPSTNFMDITPDNYFIGHESGSKIPLSGGGQYNSIIGYQAGKNLSTGGYNTMLGFNAGINASSADNNILIGNYSGNNLTIGQHNTIIGNSAGYSHTNERYNVMIGTSAGYHLNSGYPAGSYNTFMGINSGYQIRSSKENVFIGTNAGYWLDNGLGNTFIGIDAGRSNDESLWNPSGVQT